MKLRVLLTLTMGLLAYPSLADFTGDCRPQSQSFSQALNDSWVAAKDEPPSYAKDTLFSAYDYAKAYHQIMLRTPYRQDWTKGVFLAQKDKLNYAYRYVRYEPWRNSSVWYYFSLALRRFDELSWCYGY